MKYVLWINTLLIAIGIYSLYSAFSQGVGFNITLLIEQLTVAGLILVQIMLWLRVKALLGFAQVLIYALALAQGLGLFMQGGSLLTLAGAGLILFTFLKIFYFIGLRGFLRSEKTMKLFGIDIPAESRANNE